MNPATRILLKILLFPVDLLFLTLDAWIISVRRVKRMVKRENDQPCHFCQGDDHSDVPHPVRSVLKYRNEWMVRMLSPCIRFRRSGGKRHAMCHREGGFTRPPAVVPVVALGMSVFWLGGIWLVLESVSSNPGNPVRNIVTFFNPDVERVEDGGPELITESRLNPERSDRYFQSGMKFMDKFEYGEAMVRFKNAIKNNPANAKAHFHLARAYMATGQFIQAETSLQSALEYDEDYVEAMLLLARRMEMRENRERAMELAARALELEPENLEAVQLNAQLLASRGDREAVRPLMDILLEQDGEDPNTLALLGRLELSLYDDVEAAKALLTRSLERDPDHVDTLLAMIPIYGREQKGEEIQQTLNRVLEINPQHLPALRLKADLLMSQYGLSVGVREYRGLLGRFGGSNSLRLRYAQLLLQSGNITESKRLGMQLTSAGEPGIVRGAHWLLAQLYGQIKMHDEAIEHARETLRLAQNAPNVDAFLARQLMLSGEPGQAVGVLERALVKYGQDLGLLRLLTRAKVQLGRQGEAVDILQKHLADHPEEDALRMTKAEILMQTPEWREALTDTEQLYEKYPDNPALKNNLAFLLARSGQDLDRALNLVESLRDEFSDNPVIMDTYAYVHAARGDHDAALPVYEEALRRAGGNVTIRYHYARSLAAVGRVEEAVNQLRAVLIINPEFPQADEARALQEQLLAGV